MIARLFRNMDLYKGIILFSCLATPTAALVGWNMQKSIEAGKTALTAAQSKTGDLVTIGTLQKQVEKQRALMRAEPESDYQTYFVRAVMNSASTGLARSDFRIGPRQTQRAPTVPARGGSPGAIDVMVEIEFKRATETTKWALPRDFLHAILLRCESGGSQIWKLRELRVRNSEAHSAAVATKAPPMETADTWIVEKMVFTSREPAPK
jgi:hypothetical protein